MARVRIHALLSSLVLTSVLLNDRVHSASLRGALAEPGAHDVAGGSHLRVTVSPRVPSPDVYGTISVVCSVTPTSSDLLHQPELSFFWEVQSGSARILVPVPTNPIAGVTVETTYTNDDQLSKRFSLLVDSAMYEMLERGENRFVCKADTLAGQRARSDFIVLKNRGS